MNAATLQRYESAGMISGLKVAPDNFTPEAASAHAKEIATARKGLVEAMKNVEKEATEENIDKALDAVRVLNTYPSRFLLADEATQAELSKNPTFTAALNAATEDLNKIREPLEKGFAARPLSGLDRTFAETVINNAEELSKVFTAPNPTVSVPVSKEANGTSKKSAIAGAASVISVGGDMRRKIDILAHGTPYSTQLGIEATAKLKAIREELLERMEKSTHLADCELLRAVRQIRIPDDEQSWMAEANLPPEKRASFKLREIMVQYFRDCACAALNPPCQPCDDTGVLLACLEVKDCQVLRICNLERTFVLNGVSLRYWFSLDRLGDQIEKLCCPQPKAAAPLQPGASESDETRFVMAAIAQLMKVCGIDDKDVKTKKALRGLGAERLSLTSQGGAISNALSFGPQLTTMMGRVSDSRFSELSRKNADLDAEVNMLKDRLQKLEAK